jgi:hypothetical protein
MKEHPTLQKVTFIQSDLSSSVYRWFVTTLVEENPRIIGLCTDGYYDHNATWLGRFLATNDQLTEVNLSHPMLEDGSYIFRDGSYASALSLINGLGRNSTLKSIKIIGHLINERAANAIRTLLETSPILEKLECGSGTLGACLMEIILAGMQQNTVVKHLGIQSAELSLRGAEIVQDILHQNTTLEKLFLRVYRRQYNLRRRPHRQVREDQSTTSPQLAQIIARGLETNQFLKVLCLPNSFRETACLEHFCHPQVLSHLERLQIFLDDDYYGGGLRDNIEYFTTLNRCGRHQLLNQAVPNGLWPHVLCEASYLHLDVLRYFVTEKPDLFDLQQTQARVKKKRGITNDPNPTANGKKMK